MHVPSLLSVQSATPKSVALSYLAHELATMAASGERALNAAALCDDVELAGALLETINRCHADTQKLQAAIREQVDACARTLSGLNGSGMHERAAKETIVNAEAMLRVNDACRVTERYRRHATAIVQGLTFRLSREPR